MRGLPQKQNARRADKIRLCGHLGRYKKIVKKTYIISAKSLSSITCCPRIIYTLLRISSVVINSFVSSILPPNKSVTISISFLCRSFIVKSQFVISQVSPPLYAPSAPASAMLSYTPSIFYTAHLQGCESVSKF